MVFMADPVQGDSANKAEFAQTLRLDATAIPINGVPLSSLIDRVELTTKIQNARGFSYLSLEFKDPMASTPASWNAIGQAIANYLQANTTAITDAMVMQSGWPEC